MAFYLLPWSSAQSSAGTVRGRLRDVWGNHRFSELNPLREKILTAFPQGETVLAPPWRRYRGRFWEELSAWALPGRVLRDIEERGIVLSPLFGLLSAGDPVPRYALRWEDRYGGTTLRTLWRKALRPVLCELFDSVTVFDFLSSRERSLLFFPPGTRRVTFTFYRGEKRVINDLPHRAYTLRYIAERSLSVDSLNKINFLDYSVEDMEERGSELRVVIRGGGAYL